MIAAEAGFTGQIEWDTTMSNGSLDDAWVSAGSKNSSAFMRSTHSGKDSRRRSSGFLPIATIFEEPPSRPHHSCETRVTGQREQI